MSVRRTATVVASAVAVAGLSIGLAVGAADAATVTHKTEVSHSQSANSVRKGRAVTFSVSLRDAKTKRPLRNSTARLQRKRGSTWITLKTVRTGTKGTASTSLKPVVTHSWRWVAPAFVRSGVKHARGVSAAFTIAVKVAQKTMNLNQIAQGNYRSLLGRWTEAAYGGSGLGGPGFQWHPGGTDTLSVALSKIVNGPIVVRGDRLSDGQGLKNAKLVFKKSGKYLTAGLKDPSVAINYAVYFYPRGVPAKLMLNNGVKVPRSANRIVIWTSNNTYTEVFSQK
jgi:hypothetical protein